MNDSKTIFSNFRHGAFPVPQDGLYIFYSLVVALVRCSASTKPTKLSSTLITSNRPKMPTSIIEFFLNIEKWSNPKREKAPHLSSSLSTPLQTLRTPGSPPAAPRSAGVGLCRWATRWPTRCAPRLAAPAAPRRPFFPVPGPGAPCPAARRSWPPGTKNSTARRRKNGKDYSVYSNSPKHFGYLWFLPFLFSCSCPMEPYLRIKHINHTITSIMQPLLPLREDPGLKNESLSSIPCIACHTVIDSSGTEPHCLFLAFLALAQFRHNLFYVDSLLLGLVFPMLGIMPALRCKSRVACVALWHLLFSRCVFIIPRDYWSLSYFLASIPSELSSFFGVLYLSLLIYLSIIYLVLRLVLACCCESLRPVLLLRRTYWKCFRTVRFTQVFW